MSQVYGSEKQTAVNQKWKTEATRQIRQAATIQPNRKLREGLPDTSPGHHPRPCISLAGAKSRYGGQARCKMVRKTHKTLGPTGSQEDRGDRVLCETCRRRHHSKGDLPDLVDVIRCEESVPSSIQAYHGYVCLFVYGCLLFRAIHLAQSAILNLRGRG